MSPRLALPEGGVPPGCGITCYMLQVALPMAPHGMQLMYVSHSRLAASDSTGPVHVSSPPADGGGRSAGPLPH